MKKENKRVRINAADVIITILLAAVLLTIFGRAVVESGESAREDTEIALRIELVCDSVKTDYAMDFSAGDTVYFAETSERLGVIRSVSTSEYTGDEKGDAPEAFFDTVRIRIVLDVEASYNGTCYSVGSEPVIVGNRYALASKKAYFNAECTLLSVLPVKQDAKEQQ